MPVPTPSWAVRNGLNAEFLDADGRYPADETTYDNATSGLTSTDVQAAIDELATAGPGSVALDDLTDVVITSPSAGEVLKYDGSDWVNGTASGATFSDLGWFNVKDYGATGDGTTDDTSSIQDAIDACMTGEGGTVYFPPGIYQLDGALQSTSTYNAQLIIPQVTSAHGKAKAIRFLGSGPNVPQSEVASATAQDEAGAILRSSWNGTISGNPAVISSGIHDELFNGGGWSWVFVTFEDLEIRVPSDPKLSAIDLTSATGCRIRSLSISTNIASGSRVVPTHSNSVAVDMPYGYNSQQPDLVEDLMVANFYTGLRPSEQCNGSVAFIQCTRAIELRGNTSPSKTWHMTTFSKVLAGQCPRVLVFTGDPRWVNIALLNVEHDTGIWTNVYDIDDASNLGRGFISWHTVDPSTGPSTLNVNGGSGLSLHGANAKAWKLNSVVEIPTGTDPATNPATGRKIYAIASSGHLAVLDTAGNIIDLEDKTPTGTAGGDLSGTYPNPSVVDDSHFHTEATVSGAGAHILLADGRSTPFTFDDLLQADDGSDFLWSD